MVAPGQILVDLAWGRGGYGREVARRTAPAWPEGPMSKPAGL
jgi:hypothetical protein